MMTFSSSRDEPEYMIEGREKMNRSGKEYIYEYLPLAAGGLLMLFYNGNAAAWAPWLAPLFMLRFSRGAAGKKILLVPAVLAISHSVLMYEPFSNSAIPPWVRITAGAACGLLIFIPFLADRLLYLKNSSFINTLIFPSAWILFEYIFSLVSPLATFGNTAYTQHANLPLIQIVSITGIWGLSFIVIWFSSAANWMWENEFILKNIKTGTVIYSTTVLLILFYGEYRLTDPRPGKTVKVSASSKSYDFNKYFREALREGKYPDLKMNIHDLDLFLSAAALPGSEIIFRHEYALITGEDDAGRIVEYARKKAEEKKIYIGLPLGIVKNKDAKHLLENRVYWISPEGELLSDYIKSYTAPWETSSSSEKKVSVFKTGFGTAATVICFDMDFPGLIRQAGRAEAGMMLVPANDWRGITPFHARMALFRTVENGFSLVRPAGQNGVSIASDQYGRVLSYLDNKYSKDMVMTVEIPVERVKTLYSGIGDFFPFIAAGGLMIAVVRKIFSAGKKE
jgi:apolipoprotein N-acyltransferase